MEQVKGHALNQEEQHCRVRFREEVIAVWRNRGLPTNPGFFVPPKEPDAAPSRAGSRVRSESHGVRRGLEGRRPLRGLSDEVRAYLSAYGPLAWAELVRLFGVHRPTRSAAEFSQAIARWPWAGFASPVMPSPMPPGSVAARSAATILT